MKLTAEEKETIINFNEADATADIEVFSARLMREIRKAAELYPDDVTITESTEGAYLVTLPKKWIKVRAPMKLSDEQRAKLAENAKRLNQNK